MENMKKVYKDLYKVVIVLSIFIFGGYLLQYCVWTLPSFDGAMNLQVPQSMLNTGKYMTTWDGGKLFDNKIQTKAPVLFPIYLLWRIFGINTTAALSVNAAYVVLLVIAVWNISKYLGIPQIIRYSIVVSILAMPQFTDWAWGIYGEIPTVALFLCSVWMLLIFEENKEKRFVVYSGIFYSMAFLNKTVILLALPSFLFLFLYRVAVDKDLSIKTLKTWFIAFIIPLILFEIFHFIQMGGLEAYINGWKIELLDVFNQSGMGNKYADTANLFEKIWLHLGIFTQQFGFYNRFTIFVILLFTFVAWIINFFINRQHSYSNIIVLVMFSYFGWWLIISSTEMAWARRIVAGVVLLNIVICNDIYYMIRWILRKHNPEILKMILKYTVLLVSFTVLGGGLLNQIDRIDRHSRANMQDLANTIKDIKQTTDHAVFYGYGWWQAPVMAYMSDSTFYNIENKEIEENAYLVVDFYWAELDKNSLNNIMNQYDTELIQQRDNNYVYKIKGKKAGSFKEAMGINYGVYDDWWCQKNCSFYIQSGDEGTINMRVYYPEFEEGETFILDVSVDNSTSEMYNLTGTDTEIVLKVSPNAQHSVSIRSNFEMKSTSNDVRELSWLLSDVYAK